MSDELLTAMIPPAFDVTYETVDGTPYRCNAAEQFIQAKPQHIAELTARGFTTATATQVPAGDDLVDDVGWAVAT